MNELRNKTPLSRTETESQILAIWREVLQNEACDVNDDFLQSGGDSLAAMRCISRMRTAFGVEFHLMDFLLGQATVSQLASVIDSQSHGENLISD
jgi:acyl carrier protein